MLSGHLNCILYETKIFYVVLCGGGKYTIFFRFNDLILTLVTLLGPVFRLSRNTPDWTHSSLIHNFHTSLHSFSLLQLPGQLIAMLILDVWVSTEFENWAWVITHWTKNGEKFVILIVFENIIIWSTCHLVRIPCDPIRLLLCYSKLQYFKCL